MIKTTSLVSELDEIPSAWAFEHYLNLPERLTGQSLMVLSPFNPKDKRPSFSIFVSSKSDCYLFRDHSVGIGGGMVDLVMKLFSLTTKGEAAHKIKVDYNQFLLTRKDDLQIRDFKVKQRYRVTAFKEGTWTTVDQKYWTQFHIGSRLLNQFNVRPLESYTLSREEDGEERILNITGRYNIYGYFRTDGTLYKIYQPMVKDNKFIKVRSYIQGVDQLTFKKKYLVICSSLKDVMGFTRLGYKEAEAIAPESENYLIPEHVMNAFKMRYKSVCTLFDNDQAGIDAMDKYGQRYSMSGVILPMSKDLSDSLKDHGVQKVLETLTPLLKNALK